jgi:ADP-heptose:LPS heptosyltransferase
MLGSDTGLMHIAAASGCTTVTCFGPTRSSKWGHLDPPHQVVDGRDRDITTIQPEEVLKAVRAALSQS